MKQIVIILVVIFLLGMASPTYEKLVTILSIQQEIIANQEQILSISDSNRQISEYNQQMLNRIFYLMTARETNAEQF